MVSKVEVEHENLKIEVRGPERSSNSFICRVIADALRGAGVNHMEVINQIGDDLACIPTAELFITAREKNPLLDLAGITIFPDGPVVEEVTVFENTDRFEDDEPSDNDLELAFYED
jgi:hypothetical protein